MVTLNMTIAETPEARNEASEEARPACAKRRGAYFAALVRFYPKYISNRVISWRLKGAYVEHAVDAAKLLHAKEEDS